jgi:hypothetical protein
MRDLVARPTRAARRVGLGIALALASLAAAQGALGAGASTFVAAGLTGPFGAVVAPDNSVWVADTNLGFCKVTGDPTPFAFGSVIPSTCLGGAVPIAPGPTLSGQPAELTTGLGTFVFLPDQGTPAAVFRATWNPPTGTFVNAQPIFLSPADNANMRPSAASTTADPTVPNQVYVVARNSTHIWRIENADGVLGSTTTTQVADVTGLRVRGVASTLVGTAPPVATVFIKDSNGISSAPILPTPPVAPLPVAVPSVFNPVGALTLAYDAANRLLYSGTGNALVPADQGIDTLEQFNTLTQVQTAAPFAPTPAFPGLLAFTAVHGLGIYPPGSAHPGGVLVLDDPGAVFGNAAGLGRMFLVNKPVAHSGPPLNPATGLPSPDPAFTNSATPQFVIGGDPGAQCRIGTLAGVTLTGPVPCAGTFTAPALANGTYALAVQVPTGLFEPRVFTVNTIPPAPAAITSPPQGGLTNGAPLVAFSAAAGTTASCSDGAGRVASPCTSGSTPFTYTDGPKRLQVTLTDPAGNTMTSAVSFQVDATAPTVTFDGPAGGAAVKVSPVLVGWHASEGNVRFGCAVDSVNIGAIGSCSSPLTLGGLAPGAHTVRVQGRDLVGNVGAVATLSFSVPGPKVVGRLRLTGLRIGPKLKLSQVRKTGIPLLLGLPAGTRFIHIRLLRVIPPKASDQTLAARLQFVIKTDRKPTRAGVYSVSLLSPLVRRAFRTGTYQIEVTPGTSPSTLGVRSIKRFQVVP